MRSGDSLSILHVDDDAALGELVKTYLERDRSDIDCTVETETNPARALDRIAAEASSFDCIITDYNMPQMNGIEFVEAVRESHPTLPVLLFSGEETDDIAAEIIHAGVTDYLQKGFGTDQYTMLIRRVDHAIGSGGRFDPDSDSDFDVASDSASDSDTDPAVDITLDGVGIVGPDETFETADEGYASLYGYAADELAGKHWSDLHPEEEVEHIRTHVLPVVRKGGEWTGQSEGLRSDETTFRESKMVTALDENRLLIAVSAIDDRHSHPES